jgi:hypothetical protein
MTKEERAFAKITNKGQGFYIYREGRVIQHGGWNGLRMMEPHFSLLRVEFDFDHILDEAFQVDVKKSRIIFDPALEEAVYTRLGPAIKEAKMRYDRKKQQEVASSTIDHGSANNAIAEAKPKKASISHVDADNKEAVVTNNRGSGIKIKTPVHNNVDHENLYVEAVDDIQSGELWEPCVNSFSNEGHVTGVRLNKYHDFYTKIYTKVASQGYAVEGMDILLWAMAAAEQNNTDDELEIIWQEIREEISSNLRKLLRSVPLPTDYDIDELNGGS